MSRLGVDFRGLNKQKKHTCPKFLGLLTPIFLKRISNLFQSMLQETTFYFVEFMKQYKFTAPVKVAEQVVSENPLSPPWILVEFVPLATLTNGYLTAFNELRYLKCFQK